MTFIYQVILLSENLISDNQQFSQYQSHIYIQFIAETFLPGIIIITLYQVVEQVVNKIVCDSLFFLCD
jgi:hypothetical protein